MGLRNLYLFQFTWKSLRRNFGRVVFISTCVSVAVIAAVWIHAFLRGFGREIERAVVNTNMGHYQLQEQHYADTTESGYPQKFTADLRASIEKSSLSFSPELVMDGTTITPEGAQSMRVIGINPADHSRLMPLKEKLVEGEFLTADEDMGVVIGLELALYFQFRVGEQIVLNYQDHKGELSSELITIKGIFHHNSRGFEKRNIYISQASWQKLYFRQNLGGIYFNRVPIITEGLAQKPDIVGKDLVLKTWKQISPELALVSEFQMSIIKLFFVMVGVTVIMTILTPVQMSWQERMKELKTLSVIGISPKDIWRIGFYEVVFMVIISGTSAAVTLMSVLGIQSRTGVDFTALNRGVYIERAGIVMPRVVYPILESEQIVGIFCFIILVMGLCYALAIRNILKRLTAEF